MYLPELVEFVNEHINNYDNYEDLFVNELIDFMDSLVESKEIKRKHQSIVIKGDKNEK